MDEPIYPPYINIMLIQAEDLLTDEDDPGPCEAAALCFDILALFPEHAGAQALIWRAFRSPRLIQDNRRALSRTIDEWDDRPWQQHRRRALSFRFMSRWDGWHEEYEEGNEDLLDGPADVRKYLEQAHRQLLQDYFAGQVKGADVAWQVFREAIKLTRDPRTTMLWIGKEYANEGYFPESVDVLEEALSQFPKDEDARRLLAEVRWWRDNVKMIPWIPPDGDGSRWRRRIQQEDPEWFAEYGEASEKFLHEHILPDPEELPPTMPYPTDLPEALSDTMSALEQGLKTDEPSDGLVDWSYLDHIEKREIDESQFPKWAQRYLSHFRDPEQREYTKKMLAEQFANKALYPDDYFEEDDDEDDDGWELDESAEDDDLTF